MSYQDTAAALLPDVRNYLDITWDDDRGDAKLTGIIARGMARLDERAGAAQDYVAEGSARALLFDYCMYARAGALSQFWINYLSELTALRLISVAANRITEAQNGQESDPVTGI